MLLFTCFVPHQTHSSKRLLDISYRDHVTNAEIRDRISQAIGPYEDLLTTVKKRKLKWFGHVTRGEGLAKTVLQGTVGGGRRRGRQRKRWEDNITEWTGLGLSELVRRAEDRGEWRGLVATSSAARYNFFTTKIPVARENEAFRKEPNTVGQ